MGTETSMASKGWQEQQTDLKDTRCLSILSLSKDSIDQCIDPYNDACILQGVHLIILSSYAVDSPQRRRDGSLGRRPL
jgi:hypothetical protein